LRNFVFVQKSKYAAIKLWLVRDLKELIPTYLPWNSTLRMKTLERKIQEPKDPYETENYLFQG
jgi:hypothetical protein